MHWIRPVYPFRDKQQDAPSCHCFICQGEIYDLEELRVRPLCDCCKQNHKALEQARYFEEETE